MKANGEKGHPHGGHRERLRKRYMSEGLMSFQPHEVLELVLTYAIPRRDVNPIAHKLIEHFGGLANVFEAKLEDLCQVEGVGIGAATAIKLYMDVNQQYQLSKFGNNVYLKTPSDLGRYCTALEFGRPYETLFMICLNARKKVINTFMLEEGTLDSINVHMPKLVQRALGNRAYSVALTHNHPGGLPVPSDKDYLVTQVVIKALRTVDIKFEDHIIVGDEGEWVSMKESKYL